MSDWFDDAGNGSRVDVGKLLGGLANDAVAEMVQAGALVSLSTTSDGGALGCTVTVDGRWRREYFRDEDELLAWLAQAVAAVHSAKGSSPPSAPRQRSRRSRSA